MSNTFLFMPDGLPSPWPPIVPHGALCARLLKSGSVRQKEWWPDMSRATGGRLRPFALAIVDDAECAAECGAPALVATTLVALVAARLSVRLLLGPLRY